MRNPFAVVPVRVAWLSWKSAQLQLKGCHLLGPRHSSEDPTLKVTDSAACGPLVVSSNGVQGLVSPYVVLAAGLNW